MSECFVSFLVRSEIEKIQAGIGDKFSYVIKVMAVFLGGFIIAYTANWKVALVMSTMIPLVYVEGRIIFKVYPSHHKCRLGMHAIA